MNIWKELQAKAHKSGRPFTVLAPMEDVTDIVFRDIVLKEGRPDIFMTEFTSTDGLVSKGRSKVIHRLKYTEEQRPVIAQIWGSNAPAYVDSVKTIIDMGFDGVDINMGCPVPNVIKKNAGGGTIRAPHIAEEIIRTTRKVITASGKNDFALSVKTRIGFNEISFDWISFILQQPIDALTLHLRTVKELSKVDAHWELMNEICTLRDTIAPNTVLIGNGDITTRKQIDTARKRFGVDGVMVGRGIFENLWIFAPVEKENAVTRNYRLSLLQTHIERFISVWEGKKNVHLLKKFFKIYLKNFDDAAQLRKELIQMQTITEILSRLKAEQVGSSST